MKKLVVTSLLASAMVTGVFAQGTVIFQNNSASVVTFTQRAKDALGTVATGPSGAAFMAELYYAPNGPDPLDAGMLQGQMGAATPFIATAGRFLGGNRTTPSTTAPGANAWFQVRAWEVAYGATYEEAVNPANVRNGRQAIAGASNRFNLATGTTIPTPITSAGGLQTFSIDVVPEPSTFALGLLGLAGLFILRRRNS